MTSTVRRPWCKVCGRAPSEAGNEPLYILPFLTIAGNTKHRILCGDHIRPFFEKEKGKIPYDLMNMCTHSRIEEIAKSLGRDYLKLLKDP